MDFLSTAARQSASLRETEHRPWPLADNEGAWLMGQTWEDLLFAHWRAPFDAVREHVPRPLAVDTFDGSAWIGITPFRVRGLRLRATLPAPVVSTFLELNARTYVRFGDKAGIWFFSLDASSALAVAAARRFYRLPYFRARMAAASAGAATSLASTRTHADARAAGWRARYQPAGEAFNAPKGSLEYFLAERYCLYAFDEGRLFRADIHHRPWPLQQAEAEIAENTVAPPGIATEGEPLLHLARRQDVVVWPLRSVI